MINYRKDIKCINFDDFFTFYLDIIKNQYKITLDLLEDQQMMSFFTNPVIKANEKKDLIRKSFNSINI